MNVVEMYFCVTFQPSSTDLFLWCDSRSMEITFSSRMLSIPWDYYPEIIGQAKSKIPTLVVFSLHSCYVDARGVWQAVISRMAAYLFVCETVMNVLCQRTVLLIWSGITVPENKHAYVWISWDTQYKDIFFLLPQQRVSHRSSWPVT